MNFGVDDHSSEQDHGTDRGVWDRTSIASALMGGDVRGVRIWPQSPPSSEFEIAARRSRWAFNHLDSTAATTKNEYLECCRADLDLPDYLGRNWDALDEALGDLPRQWPRDRAGALLLWTGWSDLADANEKVFSTALDIWHDRVTEWLDLGAAAVVLALPAADIPEVEINAVAAVPRIRLGRR